MDNKKISLVGACLLGFFALGSGAQAAGVACDYDGDGRSDPAVYVPDSGTWFIMQSSDNTVVSNNWGFPTARPVLGDFDGDNHADMAVFEKQYSNWFIFASSTSNLLSYQFALHNSRAVTGDFDGDGTTDIGTYQESSGNWMVRLSSDGSVSNFNWGFPGARAVADDYDGDGITDPAVFYRPSATWWILSSQNGFTAKQWGSSQIRPVHGDFDGDGKADLAGYNLATGDWTILNSSDGTTNKINWGFLGARPVPGYYDSDGRMDMAVYHRSASNWYILQSSNYSMRQFYLGSPDASALPCYRDGGIQNLIILAFGDSITYGYSSSSGGPATGYPILMERICEPALGGHCVVFNGGRNGEGTSVGRDRIKGLLNQYKPDLTLIMEGTNDEFYKVPYGTTESNLRSMVKSAKSAGSAAIISTIPPVIKSAYRDRSAQEKLIVGFNPRIFKIATAEGIIAVDTWKAITSKPNWKTDLMDQVTANHPNDAGYLVVRDTFFGGVKKGTLSGQFY